MKTKLFLTSHINIQLVLIQSIEGTTIQPKTTGDRTGLAVGRIGKASWSEFPEVCDSTLLVYARLTIQNMSHQLIGLNKKQARPIVANTARLGVY